MIGDGCCAFVSLNLGRKNLETARKSVGNSIIMVIVSGLVLGAFYLIFSRQIITLFGGTVNEQTYACSKEYFFYITLGIPFYMFGQALNPIIRADGSPRFAMASTLAGAVINIILDPVFIFLQAMGKAVSSTLLSMIREIVFGVGFALLLPLSFGLDGVLYSMPLSDFLTFIITLVLIIKTYRELGSKDDSLKPVPLSANAG